MGGRGAGARSAAGSAPRARSPAPRRSARAARRRAPCTSRPGASRLTSGSSSIALRRSVSTASATPGYWTLTTTSSPSIVVARCTWPIDAAANARSSKSENTRVSGPPNSSRNSRSSFENGTGGTSSRSSASFACSASRSSSGRPSNSTIESTCPTFIAAPRIWPSWFTSSLTSAAVRSFCAAAARSGERTRLTVRMPAHRAPWPVTRPPTRAVRAIRPVGSLRASGGSLASSVIRVRPGQRERSRQATGSRSLMIRRLLVRACSRSKAASTSVDGGSVDQRLPTC